MLTIYQLMKHLRRPPRNIMVKSNQAQALRNIGYYHGYKGYRFIRTPSSQIAFSSLDEVLALNDFDMKIKALFYPKVMFIETALKNYVIEAVLADSKSESLDAIYNTSLTDYRSYYGSRDYHKNFRKRMILKGRINSALCRDYEDNRPVTRHFFDNDKQMPIWAVFESLSLGEFGTFFACTSQTVKATVSRILKLPSNLDTDGRITQYAIYTIKDLRNAVAHNNVIFDTRFQTANISSRLKLLLETETGILNIDFKYIDAYLILVTYFLRKMGVSKTSCKQFAQSFASSIESLRTELPANICNQIFGTQQRSHLRSLQAFISRS